MSPHELFGLAALAGFFGGAGFFLCACLIIAIDRRDQ